MQVELIEIALLAVALAFLFLFGLAARKMFRGGLRGGETSGALPGATEDAAQAEEDRLLAEEALSAGRLSEPAPPASPSVEAPPRPGAPVTLEAGLAKSRQGFMAKINKLLFAGRALDAALVDELEEVLVTADIGVRTTERLLAELRKSLERKEVDDPRAVRDRLKSAILDLMKLETPPTATAAEGPKVLMVIGVNGVGKTTTIGKLAARFSREGKKVVLAAGDTFRAAATEQLEVWAERSGSRIVKGAENGDPASVIFEAVQTAKREGADLCIADTAGRLHTKVNLMEELKKVHRVMGKAHPGAPHEVLLVLDATTGQNAIAQAKQFKEAVDVTSLALTKLDGTAKGGVVVAICEELQIPVRYIGIGEGVDDLRDFDATAFVDALFAETDGRA